LKYVLALVYNSYQENYVACTTVGRNGKFLAALISYQLEQEEFVKGKVLDILTNFSSVYVKTIYEAIHTMRNGDYELGGQQMGALVRRIFPQSEICRHGIWKDTEIGRCSK